MDENFLTTLGRGLSGEQLDAEDCAMLMSFPEDSPEASELVSRVDSFVRRRCGGKGRITAQIGIQTGPCYVDCGFCVFAASTTDQEPYTMDVPELERYVRLISASGPVSAVSLMTIGDFDFGPLLRSVETARRLLPEGTELVVNTGDLSDGEARELADAGVDAAYHAIRLREGTDTAAEPYDRLRTVRALRAAGVRVESGVEPIGPEHRPREISDDFFRMIGEADVCSASARESVPGTRLCDAGTLSPRRLLQVRGALLASTVWVGGGELGFYGGFYGGFNSAMAEYGGSPKTDDELSERGLGRTVDAMRERLRKDGYEVLRFRRLSTFPTFSAGRKPAARRDPHIWVFEDQTRTL